MFLPAFDVAGDLTHRAERVLDDSWCTHKPAPEFVRQAEADDGEDLVQPLQDATRHARFLMLQTPGQVAQEPLGLVCVVLVPGLTERLLDARVSNVGSRRSMMLRPLWTWQHLKMAAATPNLSLS